MPKRRTVLRGANVSAQKASTGRKSSGDVSCTVKVRTPGEKTSAYSARGKPGSSLVKRCMEGWRSLKTAIGKKRKPK
jgi:hypothetical protein